MTTAAKPTIEFGRPVRCSTEISTRTRWESIDGTWRIERCVPKLGPRPTRSGSARPGGLPVRYLLLRRHEAGHWLIISRHRTRNAALTAANHHARQLTATTEG